MTWMMGGYTLKSLTGTKQEHGQHAEGHTALQAAERIQHKPHGARQK